ncbi:MAG TPA: hypothetical protein VFI31_04810 [Pirellulales bacterium]|nr:hypothetical protein [Pirellulales bacterium]
MALFGKDWNVLTLTFERADLLRVNGNRTKGLDANKIRENAKRHARTVYWAVFDQKGKVLESAAGPGVELVPKPSAERLEKGWLKHESVKAVLELMQNGEMKAARIYPPADFAVAGPAPQAPTNRTYKLVVDSGEGDEFESTLKLVQSIEGLYGSLVAPDGDEVQIREAHMAAGKLTFEFTIGSGDDAVSLRFHGTVRREEVRGTFV